jgi:hypothetical protein
MTYLAKHDIPFILRIKEDFDVRLADRRHCKIGSLFQKLAKGGGVMSETRRASGSEPRPRTRQ